MDSIDVYIETSPKYTFAGALRWPGWCRRGRDEQSALDALFNHAPRYGQVLEAAGIAFDLPNKDAFTVVERLEGNATTAFGAPAVPPTYDADAVTPAELEFYLFLLTACWEAFDRAFEAARGKQLRTGPRGGGRDREKIMAHVVDSDKGYLAKIGWKLKLAADASPDEKVRQTR